MSATGTDGGSAVRSAFGDDPDFAEILHLFVDSLPEKAESLRAAVEIGAYPDLAAQAHQLKGSAGGYGFEGLTPLAAELEAAAREEAPARVAPALDRVLNYFERITC